VGDVVGVLLPSQKLSVSLHVHITTPIEHLLGSFFEIVLPPFPPPIVMRDL